MDPVMAALHRPAVAIVLLGIVLVVALWVIFAPRKDRS